MLTVTLPSNRRDGCSVNRVADNRPFLSHIAQSLAAGADGAVGECWRESVGTHRGLPEALVLAGHSAGGDAAAFIAGHLIAGPAADRLRGVVLLDPVPSARGRNLRIGLRALSGRCAVLGVTADPARCNAKNAGERAMQQELDQPVVGLHITGGRHHDAEGANSSRAADWICGRRNRANIALLQALAADWTEGMLSGRITARSDAAALDLDLLADRGSILWAGQDSPPRHQ